MEKIILAWALVAYTALTVYSFMYALTVKPDEVKQQGTIPRLLYINAIFMTVLLVFGAVISLAVIAVTLLSSL